MTAAMPPSNSNTPKDTFTKYLIYDGRYNYPDMKDRATIMLICDSLKEAQRERTDYGDDCVIVETHIVDGVADEKDDEVMPNE